MPTITATGVLQPTIPGPGVTGGLYGPAYAMDTLGNMQVGGPTWGGGLITQVAYRFRAEQSSTLTKFRPFIVPATSPYIPSYSGGTGGTLRMTVETDNNGVPSGTVLATRDLTGLTVAANKMAEYTIASPPTLTAGTLYHLVWTNIDPNPLTNYVSIDMTYVFGAILSPRQPRWPDADFMALRRVTTGSWSAVPSGGDSQGQYTPIIDLTYGNGAHQGQGYMEVELPNYLRINGRYQARELFTVSGGNKTVTGASLRVSKIAGSDSGALTATLEDSSGNPIDSCTMSTSSLPTQVPTADSGAGVWVSGTFTQARTLVSGSTYRLRFTTAGTTDLWTRGIQQGDGSWGFNAATYFTDGYCQASLDTGATWATVTGLSTSGDLQFYLTLGG